MYLKHCIGRKNIYFANRIGVILSTISLKAKCVYHIDFLGNFGGRNKKHLFCLHPQYGCAIPQDPRYVPQTWCLNALLLKRIWTIHDINRANGCIGCVATVWPDGRGGSHRQPLQRRQVTKLWKNREKNKILSEKSRKTRPFAHKCLWFHVQKNYTKGVFTPSPSRKKNGCG